MPKKTIVTTENLLPSQVKFLRSTKQHVLYSGGVGCGKTYVLMMCLFQLCTSFPGLNALVVTGTFPQLRDTIYREFIDSVHHKYIHRHYKNTNTLEFHNGSRVFFRSFDDAKKIGGFTVGLVIAEEATTLKKENFDALCSRLRQEGMPRYFRAACNPSSPNHWLYNVFIENPVPDSEVIYGVSYENKYLPDDYLRLLDRYKGSEYYKRMVMGEWCALEGLVYDLPQKLRVLKTGTYNFGGIDFGDTHPCAFNVISKLGDIYAVVDEYSRVQMNIQEIIDRAKQMTEEHKVVYWVCDSARPEHIRALSEAGVPADPASKAKDSVQAGISKINALIASDKLYVNPACTKTLKEFDSYVWDGNERRDAPIKANDHHLDAIRYAITEEEDRYTPNYGRMLKLYV